MAEPTHQALPLETAPPAAPAPLPRRSRLRALSGVLLLLAMAGGVWAFGYWEPRLLPVRTIEVQGELHHHSSELLRDTLIQRLQGGFLTADLRDLKQAAEGLPWVGGASIRRVWPDRLQVRVIEHRPVARWKGDGLVTAEGVIFRPSGPVPAGLPLLDGDESRARELVERYLKWRDTLMLAGQLIDTLAVDSRGAWRLDLVSNTRVELGTADIERRLTRFIGAASQLEAAGRAKVVDLRYNNGFAVKWAGNAEPDPVPPSQARPDRKVRHQGPVPKGAKRRAGAQTEAQGQRTPARQRATRAHPRTTPGSAPTPKARVAAHPSATPAKARTRQKPPPSGAPVDARGPARALTQALPARH
ncbi:cell division protein FtsQ/DivIB [uncultured Thiodictyon sp.]|uniref:cell division protein FtsQ/DivIB n=1 Tax=uncultured Thiodictyon sp. TaxID=1846217 RepID=UPI0025DC9A1E|nr:cell division protein FtsQ/DivIB [uncultured Thiodictyon sp.]